MTLIQPCWEINSDLELEVTQILIKIRRICGAYVHAGNVVTNEG